MTATVSFLAVDLGASSGRVLVGRWDDRRFTLEELHRFPNGGVAVRGHLYWDILHLWHEIQDGVRRAAMPGPPAGIGVDSWAVDFALLDRAGNLLGNPHHYRDGRTAGVDERVFARLPWPEVFARTGIQLLPFNTLYQLASMAWNDDPRLRIADSLLLIPDLIGYWLTGRKVAEYTNASTTQLLDCAGRTWAADFLDRLDIPSRLLPPLVQPGIRLGELQPAVAEALGLPCTVPVYIPATHDTASAVAAVPGLDRRSAYISSGTWSLVGLELPAPILTDAARAANVTNEGGVAGTIRFLKNVTGLWLLQECQRQWRREGQPYPWDSLQALAAAAPPLQSLIDPDAPDFLNPGDMPATVRAYCARRNLPPPESVGALARCCLESVALKCALVLDTLERLAGVTVETIRIVGGGSQNELLCRFTADACRREVVAGPVEATALGNILVQAIAAGHIGDLAAGRDAIAASVALRRYAPDPGAAARWQEAIGSWRGGDR